MPTPPDRRTPEDFLPLKPDAFYVLLVLLHGDRHGYAIMREAAERSDHRVELQAGALYRLLARMLEDGLVVESQRRPAVDADDERRRYYRVTALGKRTIAAERLYRALLHLYPPRFRRGADWAARYAMDSIDAGRIMRAAVAPTTYDARSTP